LIAIQAATSTGLQHDEAPTAQERGHPVGDAGTDGCLLKQLAVDGMAVLIGHAADGGASRGQTAGALIVGQMPQDCIRHGPPRDDP